MSSLLQHQARTGVGRSARSAHRGHPAIPFDTREPELNYVRCPEARGGHHRMAWWQWGDARASRVILCVHGLMRQGRDFDTLARALLQRAGEQGERVRVVCPDIVGRGRSDWLAKAEDYQYATYLADIHALLQALARSAPVQSLDWVGTSMGGLIGIPIAAESAAGHLPVMAHLVLNDVGPVLEPQALARIGATVKDREIFADETEAEVWLRAHSPGVGLCSDADWHALSGPQLRLLQDGHWGLRHDPKVGASWDAITAQGVTAAQELLWTLYDRIRASTLVVHGADSDFLSTETLQRMTDRGPRAQAVEFAGVGHAPMLIAPEQTAAVTRFLLPDY